jgi:hypothetical protein
VGVLLLAVVVVLVAGIVVMARGGDANRQLSNKLMGARVALQAAALAVVLLLMLSR